MNHIVSINIVEKRGSQSPTYKSTHKNTEGERETGIGKDSIQAHTNKNCFNLEKNSTECVFCS